MLGLFLLGYASRKVGKREALIGVIVGVAIIAWISLAEPLNLPGPHLHEYLAIVLGTASIFITGFLLGVLFGKKNA